MNVYRLIVIALMSMVFASVYSQVENAGAVRRVTATEKKTEKADKGVTDRVIGSVKTTDAHDADLEYMRRIHRRLDLKKPVNAALYYPEDVVDGEENLFRIILGNVVAGNLAAYEYLDGHEIFSDLYKINVGEMLDRFGIYAKEGKGSSGKNKKFVIDEADVPVTQVLNYYLIEKWEFDTRSNRMKMKVEAICPVLTRIGDFGDETNYPMFWIKYEDLRPYLMNHFVFTDDDNNVARFSLDDYFMLDKYDGEIYKTRNLRNLTMAEMYPDEDARKHASDSIDARLRSYGKNLWVPTREEYLAAKAKEEEAARKGVPVDSISERTVVTSEKLNGKTSATARRRNSSAPKKQVKESNSSYVSGNAVKSVRRRRR